MSKYVTQAKKKEVCFMSTELETKDKQITEQKSAESAEPKKKKRRRRYGDRKDGYRLRTVNVMNKAMPYIMPMRCDALNTYADEFDITRTEQFVREQIQSGLANFSILHVILAAYVRSVAKFPAVNRFVSGQKIYARNDIQVVMTIKKKMSLTAPDTCIKVWFEPEDTVYDIYEKFNKVVEENKQSEDSDSSFDKLNKALCYIPGLLLRWTVKLLQAMDYWGLLPKKLTNLSPFHGSMIITSMGSLGVKPIYHHLYNFGNLPIFISYGSKRTARELDATGNVKSKKVIDLKIVMDERICDGYYYASAFRHIKKLIENPDVLMTPPEEVEHDID